MNRLRLRKDLEPVAYLENNGIIHTPADADKVGRYTFIPQIPIRNIFRYWNCSKIELDKPILAILRLDGDCSALDSPETLTQTRLDLAKNILVW